MTEDLYSLLKKDVRFIRKTQFLKATGVLIIVSRTIPTKSEGIIPCPLGKNKWPGLAPGFIPVIEGLNSCTNCGTRTAICPATEFYNYDPRLITETVQSKDSNNIKGLLSSDTMELAQCVKYPMKH